MEFQYIRRRPRANGTVWEVGNPRVYVGCFKNLSDAVRARDESYEKLLPRTFQKPDLTQEDYTLRRGEVLAMEWRAK